MWRQVYYFDDRLSVQENQRLSIAAHSKDGPGVPVVVGDPRRGDCYTSHWLYPTGGCIGKAPLELVTEPPQDEPPPGYDHLFGDAYQQCLRMKKSYWTIRVQMATQAFEDAQRAALGSPEPTAEDVKKLEAMRADIAQLKARVEAAEQAIHPATVPPPEYTPPTKAETEERARVRYSREVVRAAIQALTK